MQDSVTTPLVAVVRTPETMPFCIFFFKFGIKRKYCKKNPKKKKKKPLPLKSKLRSEEHPNLRENSAQTGVVSYSATSFLLSPL